MSIRFAINGLGRIGRALFRVALGHQDLELVAVHDRAQPEALARLINYDSVHGRLHPPVRVEGDGLIVGARRIAVFEKLERVPWWETGASIVVEATGEATRVGQAAIHLGGSVEAVLISALSPDAEQMLCPGVSWSSRLGDPPILSAASCTTHCLALLLGVVDKTFGVERALMNEVHSYTGNQRLLDGVHDGAPRRERSAAMNIIPTTTAAPAAVERLMPGLGGRIDGQAVRVPTPNMAMLDAVIELRRPASVETVRQAFRAAASGDLEGVLGTSEEPLVSSDYIGDPHSAIVDLPLLQVVDERLCRVVAWYDNEWGYANRLADFLTWIGETLASRSR